MTSRNYFAIWPTRELLSKLADAGLSVDIAIQELVSKTTYDRTARTLDDELCELKSIYLAEFRRRIEIESAQSESAVLKSFLPDFSIQTFDNFWRIAVFDDCTEFEQLASGYKTEFKGVKDS